MGVGAGSATGRSAAPVPGSVGDRLGWAAAALGLERWARLAAVAVMPLLISEADRPRLLPVFAVLAGYVLLTALANRRPALRAADVLMAAAMTALSQGEIAPLLPFLVVTIAAPAAYGGVRDGVVTGLTLAGVVLVTLAATDRLGPGAGLPNALLTVPLLPATGLAAAWSARIMRERDRDERVVLEEANRLLSSLQAIAGDLPGGLDATTVAAAVLAELRALPEAAAVLVLVDEDGVLLPAAAAGLGETTLPTLRIDEARSELATGGTPRLLQAEQLPAPLGAVAAASGHPVWALVPVTHERSLLGLLVVGVRAPEDAELLGPRLRSIAQDTGLALDNARLFDGTRQRAADAARRRIAGDLHDGVAQSLAHLRMELELLAAAQDGNGELTRLSEIAQHALDDLRGTIAGLRQPVASDLAAQLERHIEHLRRDGGPVIAFEVLGSVRLDPERTGEVLRIAQEALSNAFRHARAREITVWLEGDEDEINLTIEDDGVGLAASTPEPAGGGTARLGPRRRSPRTSAGGVGVSSMAERAARMDGSVKLRDRIGGGTLVHLRLPTDQRRGDRR